MLINFYNFCPIYTVTWTMYTLIRQHIVEPKLAAFSTKILFGEDF